MTDTTDGPVLLENPHVVEVPEILKHYNVTLDKGLNDKQVTQHRKLFGAHTFAKTKKASLFQLLISQFDDLLVRILLLAAIISFILTFLDIKSERNISDYIEPMVILVILVLNAIVGVWQEANAERALDALKQLQPELASCLRNGKWITMGTEELVVGDVVRIKNGDKIPADVRVAKIFSTSLAAEQSQLTGESSIVFKTSNALPKSMESCEIQSKKNILFSSTTITCGNAVGIVVATGMSTEIGAVQYAVMEASQSESTTPLQKMLHDFGATLSKAISAICVIVWVINFKNFADPIHGSRLRGCIYYFKIAIALAVAAIPEGLPAVITTCLALGTRKMAKRNAIVRKLPSVETLGCTTVICSDKTGTLTTNKMTSLLLTLFNENDELKYIHVPAVGHDIRVTLAPTDPVDASTPLSIAQSFDSPIDVPTNVFCQCASLCSDAVVTVENGKVAIEGEPTETAILELVDKLGKCLEDNDTTHIDELGRFAFKSSCLPEAYRKRIKKEATLEFCRHRKMMSVLTSCSGKVTLFSKGAPESILERATSYLRPDGTVVPLTPKIRALVQRQLDSIASQALRTLAFAYRTDAQASLDLYKERSGKDVSEGTPKFFKEIEKDLVLIGLVGIMDPPRPEVRASITKCLDAGIRVIMITGDNKITAEAISRQVGIIRDDGKEGVNYFSYTGKEFEDLAPEDQKLVLSVESLVFSRTEPKHKQNIVSILKELGETVAMTGDGVNDAPALKMADIGISMGITGTEVAKEASDMILADDNFQTIVAAIEEGRCIYSNMKAFIRYLISSNIGEVVSIFLTAALGIPEGMLPVQLLWVNLVTDGPPATALGFNPPDLNIMKKGPRSKNDRLIDLWTLFRYLVVGTYVGFATTGIFIQWYVWGISPSDGNPLVTLNELMHWSECNKEGASRLFNIDDYKCSYFTTGKVKPSTLSLTTLVVIEMLNAFNALSEDCSLFVMPPWANPYLIIATIFSISIHCIILYTPFLAQVFNVTPLDKYDWLAVVLWSLPVIIIDELLKLLGKVCKRKPTLYDTQSSIKSGMYTRLSGDSVELKPALVNNKKIEKRRTAG
ncbi:p-type ATPase family member protein [Theileria equi strain WA]|uniref:P-type ATPase family member protein n=1 Tax=Theileria equi strain WA TaxID=1537102 RepID=L0AV73_THEEQ|nr:p-type ATPase family member protein [Theileria equi strain WA]AFZ79435.1 p-type ATPase family member protein [Theileria equi strain WA]|eukprot:XP_004829101.1 p-type ATPase family member protein [Theileria equi strain WA]